jgi:hypothetical protein
MSASDTVLASLAGTRLTVAGLFGWLQTQGRLEPLVREALAAQLVQEQARQAGLSVTDEELQTAADDCRRRYGLHSAADTQAWLSGRPLSADDFEAALEQDLFAVKLRQHLTGSAVDGHFAAHQAGFECLTVAQVLVPREDLARELASQVREEGRELADVAGEQGLQLVRGQWFRKGLADPLASAGSGQLVGPLATPKGFVLAVVEEVRPAELDTATRRHIQDEMYQGWLTGRMREAIINLPLAGAS